MDFGGQGLPVFAGVVKSEMNQYGELVLGICPGLSLSAMNTVYLHGTEEQNKDVPPAADGGRLGRHHVLDGSQCGTDLGQLKPGPDEMPMAHTG